MTICSSPRSSPGTDDGLATTFSNRTGLAYFEALVCRLGAALDADFACVARVDADGETLVPVASHAAAGRDWPAALTGAPWPLVLAGASLLRADGAGSLYADNPAFAGIRACAGTPLVDAGGRTLGLIAVMSRRPFAQPPMVGFVLELFAERAAAELERLAAERQLRRTEAALRRQQLALLRIVHAELLIETEADTALARIAEITGETLDAACTGIWQADADFARLRRRAGWSARNGRSSDSVPVLDAGRCPGFVGSLRAQTLLDSCDARHAGAFAEWQALDPSSGDGGARLVLGISSGRTLHGLLQIELPARTHAWSLDELGFARSVCDLLALCLVTRALHRTVAEREASERRYRDLYEHIDAVARERLQALETHQQRMHQMQRQFVYMASHELRTPLAIIDSAAQRILRRADTIPHAELIERVGKIRAAVSRMGFLVDSTLDVARFESGTIGYRPGPVDIGALLERVCQQQQELAAHHRIERRFEALPATMSGDAGLLEQVFANLLSNAVKYSPDADGIDVQACGEATRVVIRVRDHGVGIPQSELPRLFEKFFRASTAVGIPGTGIGLSITRQIVELHGGILSVDSTVGTGTTFTVKLPLPAAS